MDFYKILKIIFLLSIIYLGACALNTQLFSEFGSDALKGPGDYIVGEDIPAGEYYVKCTGFNLYVEDAHDFSGDYNGIIYYVDTLGGSYISVRDGEHLIIRGGELYELDNAPVDKSVEGYYKEGMFKVGTDIPAGEYIIESSDQGYFEVSIDSRHSVNGIVNNEFFEGNRYITLWEGQYITLKNGARIKS